MSPYANPSVLFALLASVVALFLCFFLYGRIRYRACAKSRYSCWNQFPFEMYGLFRDYPEGPHRASLVVLESITGLYLLSLLSSALYLIMGFSREPGSRASYLLLSGIFLALLTLGLFYLLLVPARYNKAHIAMATLYFAASFGFALMGGFFLVMSALPYDGAGQMAAFVIGIVLFVFSGGEAVLMMSPKYADWARLESQAGSDGEVVVKRPKRFLLAYSEWGMLFANELNLVLLFLGLILMTVDR